MQVSDIIFIFGPLNLMEIDLLLPSLVGLGLLLFFSGFFSGSETALCALTQVQIERLRNEKRKTSTAIVNFVDNSRRFFITILLGNTFINIAFATICTDLILKSQLFGENIPGWIEFVISNILITLLLLIFGEIPPKTYAIKHAEAFSRITARPLWIFSILILPLRSILRGITDFLVPLFGDSHTPEPEQLTAENFKAIVSMYEGQELDEDEREILGNILELRNIEAKEIMVPRTEMVAVETSVSIQEVIDKAKAVGFSRIPVYRRQIDDICGIFHVKDLPFWQHVDIRNLTIEDFLAKRRLLGKPQFEDTLVRQPFFVLETKKIADLLSDLIHGKTKMAILLDEYGGVSGIVTIEDIMEEVVGDIIDEHDNSLQSPEIIQRPDNPTVIEMSSRVSVREINQRFQLKIDKEIADTVGGYVFGLFGRVPSIGEFIVDENDVKFEVAAVEENFIGAVIMTLPRSVEPEDDASDSSAVKSRSAEPQSRKNKAGQQSTVKFLILLLCCYFLIGADTPLYGLFSETRLLSMLLLTFGLILFVSLSAFYSGSETALVSVNKVRINQLVEEGNKKAKIVKNLIESPDRMLGLTLVGTNIANVGASQIVLFLVIALLGTSGTTHLPVIGTFQLDAKVVATVVTTVIILIFGEILPKIIFRLKADSLVLRYAFPLRISEIILGFIVSGMTTLTNALVKSVDRDEESDSSDAQRDELRLLATMGEQSGDLLTDQRRMIHSVLDLQNRTVEQMMVPLVDIVSVEKDTDVETLLQVASESGFSRIPVYDERIDNIIGIVHLLDIIYSNGDAPTIHPFIRTNLQFVPEPQNINVLLRDIPHSHHTMVFVVDEYSGIVGLVTVEDLVEEIVGEVSDERDEPHSVRMISSHILECDGRTEVETLSERFGVPIPQGDYETIAGYILDRMGTIPRPGEEIDAGDALIITISDADARAIRKVRIRSKLRNFTRPEA